MDPCFYITVSLNPINSPSTVSLNAIAQGTPVKRLQATPLGGVDSAFVSKVPEAIWAALEALPDVRPGKVAEKLAALEKAPQGSVIDGLINLLGVNNNNPVEI